MKLLIVDDEPSVLQFLKATLQPLTQDVVAVQTSDAAIDYIERQSFDGIIFDVKMPALDGFALTRRTRASVLNARSPIALLTGYDDAETMREGFKAGATCFLGKPITREKIQSLVGFMRGPVMFEKRRCARLQYSCTVNCAVGPLREHHFIGESINLGESGMLLHPSGGIGVGGTIHLEFEIPTSDKPLRLRGTVLRHEPPDRVAVQFTDSSIRDREAIQEFILQSLQ